MEVAWNQVRVSELVSNKEERDRLFAEIRVLKQLKHKNIMTFYDSWLDQKTYCVNFITELFTSGTLRQCVQSSHFTVWHTLSHGLQHRVEALYSSYRTNSKGPAARVLRSLGPHQRGRVRLRVGC